MTEHRDSQYSPRLEDALHTLYAANPEAGFVANLERRLLEQGQSLPGYRRAAGAPRCSRPAIWCHRWVVGALAVLLALAATLAAIGPQRVWAQVQRLLGYVPGIGFVDLDKTRLLAAPVSMTRDGITLVVEQVVAGQDKTAIVLHSEGLPPEDEVWPEGARHERGADPKLHLSDGQVLVPQTFRLNLGAGTLEFPPLPEGAYRVTLELPRLPLVPAGAAPEGWEVPLILRPATGGLVAELFPQPYTLSDASDTHEGVTLRVLDVASSPEETALRLQVQWQDPAWEFPYQSRIGIRDDLGHIYSPSTGNGSTMQTKVVALNPGSTTQTEVVVIGRDAAQAPKPTPSVPTLEEVYTFVPSSPLARQLTLVVDEITFEVPAEGGFAVDLGDHPQIGDYWPMDIDLEVANSPVHILGARLMEEVTGPRDQPEQRTVLRFEITSMPGQAKRVLHNIGLDGQAAGFRGGSGGGYNYLENRLYASLTLKQGDPIPNGVVRVQVHSANVAIRGPWEITWAVPGAASGERMQAAPVVLHPEGTSQHRGDLALRVDQVVLTDRLTFVKLALDDAPPGAALFRLLSQDQAGHHQYISLTDDRGHDYGFANAAGALWRPLGDPEPDPTALTFKPIEPLAGRLTLRVPGVAVALPGQAAFDIQVPAGLTMTVAGPEQLAPSGPPYAVLSSAPWTVDIPVEIAGHPLRFTQARLQDMDGRTVLMLTSDPYTPPKRDRWLFMLHLARVTSPDGRRVSAPPPDGAAVTVPFGMAGPMGQAGGKHRATLCFYVTDPATGLVQPGTYHVELAGITEAVYGPWEFSWRSPER